MKLSTRYEQTSCRLVLDGLPDLSAGQSSSSLGILTGFTLSLAGRTELEGQREHLQALLAVVLPYARHLISAQPRAFGLAHQPVALQPTDAGHRLELRSSQPDTPPLSLVLDDAELADLVRCLDQLLLDPKVAVPLQQEPPRPLRRGEVLRRQPLTRRLAAPVAGVGSLLLAAGLLALLPIQTRRSPSATPAPATAAPAAPAPAAPAPVPPGR
jgi:hypothetical protein